MFICMGFMIFLGIVRLDLETASLPIGKVKKCDKPREWAEQSEDRHVREVNEPVAGTVDVSDCVVSSVDKCDA
jgi:hypothetical protein